MKKKTGHILLIALLVAVLGSCGVNKRISRADKRYEIGEYYAAADLYKTAYSKLGMHDPRRGEVAFKQAECYRKINNTRAATVYLNAIRNHYADSVAYLRQAQALQYQGKYSDAAKAYTIYLKTHPDDSVALGGLMACKNVGKWRKNNSRYQVALAKELNDKRSSSFSPQYVGGAEDVVMFTSNRRASRSGKVEKSSSITGVPVNRLYTIRKDASGKWESAEAVEGVGSEHDDGVATTTPDGTTLYFTRALAVNGSDHGAALFMSSRSGGTWGEPQYVELFKDSTITVAHPSLSAEGQTLYFVSDAPGGMGGLDIWKATNEDGKWIPENLGAPVNTADDEMFPYIRDNGELYFASKGHPGFGGLDLFKAVMKADSSGLEVLNLGSPFNTAWDDFGICFAPKSERGYFSSNRNQKRSVDQIYSFVLPELECFVQGRVTDNGGEAVSEGFVRIVGNDGMNARVVLKKDGSYRFRLAPGVNYVMLGAGRGFLNQKQEINTHNLRQNKTFTQDFVLAPISKPVTMDNIFYEFGKWDLTPASEEELQKLVRLLNDNPNITIELSAHTDSVGSAAANKTLSEKRAQSVVNYLIKHGIDSERLTPVGYGEELPKVVDAALHKQYPFLPEGQILDPAFISTLKPDQQQTANQVNRRTEFRVLKTTYNLY